MADQPDLKKKLLGWVQGALNKVESALETQGEETAAPATPPARPASPTGALTGPPARGSGQLPPINRPPVTGSLARGSDSLVRGRAPEAPRAAPASPTSPLRSPEEEAAESKKRLAFIMAYMKDPEGDAAFKDKPLVYRILSEERAYQQSQLVLLEAEFKQLPPSAASLGLSEEEALADARFDGLEERRAELENRLNTARTRQTQLFMLMKKLTGVKGKTGGTGFLAPPKLPQRRADDMPFQSGGDKPEA